MAFFRNYSNERVSPSVLNEKIQGQSMDRVQGMMGNENVEAMYSDKDSELKIDGHYRSDDEPDDANRLQDDAAPDNGIVSNLQPSGRRTALAGKWGSTFWKDCQPMRSRAGSESGQESKSGSEYKNEAGSEEDSSDGREDRLGEAEADGQKEAEKVRRQIDVPADEMSSDDYYEQDGDDQTDSLPYRPLSNSSEFNSKPQSRSVDASNNVGRNSRTQDGEEYDDNDADYEDDDADDGNCVTLIYLGIE